MKLSDYMTRLGLSDEDLARKLGLTAKTVYRWRVGLRMPKPEVADLIVEVTGGLVSHSDIYARRPRGSQVEARPAGLPEVTP